MVLARLIRPRGTRATRFITTFTRITAAAIRVRALTLARRCGSISGNNLIYDWGFKAGYDNFTNEFVEMNYVNNYLVPDRPRRGLTARSMGLASTR